MASFGEALLRSESGSCVGSPSTTITVSTALNTLSVVEDTSEERAARNEPIVAVAVPALSLPRFTGLRCAIYSQRSRVQLEL
jgi:hypothetical protein